MKIFNLSNISEYKFVSIRFLKIQKITLKKMYCKKCFIFVTIILQSVKKTKKTPLYLNLLGSYNYVMNSLKISLIVLEFYLSYREKLFFLKSIPYRIWFGLFFV